MEEKWLVKVGWVFGSSKFNCLRRWDLAQVITRRVAQSLILLTIYDESWNLKDETEYFKLYIFLTTTYDNSERR